MEFAIGCKSSSGRERGREGGGTETTSSTGSEEETKFLEFFCIFFKISKAASEGFAGSGGGEEEVTEVGEVRDKELVCGLLDRLDVRSEERGLP